MFACRTDALTAIEQWQEKQATLAVEATVLEVPVYKAMGIHLWKNERRPPNRLGCLSLQPMMFAAH